MVLRLRSEVAKFAKELLEQAQSLLGLIAALGFFIPHALGGLGKLLLNIIRHHVYFNTLISNSDITTKSSVPFGNPAKIRADGFAQNCATVASPLLPWPKHAQM